MKWYNSEENFTYDDVLLVPRKSLVSRDDVQLDYNPIIPAPMDTIAGPALVKEQLRLGGIGILHRYMSVKDKIELFSQICDMDFKQHGIQKNTPLTDKCFIAVGVDRDEIDKLLKASVDNFCIDVANGYSQRAIDLIKYIKSKDWSAQIIAGNVGSIEGYIELAHAGADYVRVGIGPGSLCTTRLVTGNGFPQLSLLNKIWNYRTSYKTRVIADGGIKNSGDIVKALAAGADYIMAGQLFAGCDETPGNKVYGPNVGKGDNQLYKKYRGMASLEAQIDAYPDKDKNEICPEGVETLIKCKGPYLSVLNNLLAGLKSGMSYQTAKNFTQLRENAEFIKVTRNTVIENSPHSLLVKS